jgi:hypothetical protein
MLCGSDRQVQPRKVSPCKVVSVAELSTTRNTSETLMANAINTGTMLIAGDAFLAESLRLESEPWTSFYMAGEMIRELRKAPKNRAGTGGRAPQRPEDHRRDEEASSRMDDEGCPNERTATLPDATGCSGIGGRLHLVGSPIF